MTYAQHMEDPFRAIEIVDHAIIADTQPKCLHTFHSMMRMGIKSRAEAINGGFDPCLNGRGQFEEISVEIARVDLKRGGH